MSAAWFFFFETNTAAIFKCPCSWLDKKRKGCVRPTRAPQAIFKCPACGGGDKKCLYCRGKDQIKIHRCPRAIVTPDILSIVPYFVDYVSCLPAGKYPDGRTRLYQPIKLISLFSMWLKIYMEIKAGIKNEQ